MVTYGSEGEGKSGEGSGPVDRCISEHMREEGRGLMIW